MQLPTQLLHVRSAFDGATFPWFIAGGWAIDLFLDRVTRPHGDVDVAVFRDDLESLRTHFREWTASVAIPEEKRYRELDRSEEPPSGAHELRFARGDAEVEILLTSRRGEEIVFRRDERITRALDSFELAHSSGLRHVAPEWQLLYKAKYLQDKTELDFTHALPQLGPERRAWLVSALELHAPGHHWIVRL